MKRKISMSFVLLVVMAVLSLSEVFRLLRSLLIVFTTFNPRGLLGWLTNMTIALTPAALVTMLVLNSKQDVKKIAFIVSLVCGIAQLLGLVLNINNYLNMLGGGDIFTIIRPLGNVVNKIVVGILLIMGAFCIKQEKKKTSMAVITIIVFYLLLIPAGAGLITGQEKLLSAVSPLLLLSGVCLFPRAIFDHENCVLATGTPLKVAVGIAVVFAFVLLISGGITSGGSSGGGGRTCAKSGCNNRAVSSGDSVYCSSHSNRCGNCGCYIDGDAMFCMDCIRGAIR